MDKRSGLCPGCLWHGTGHGGAKQDSGFGTGALDAMLIQYNATPPLRGGGRRRRAWWEEEPVVLVMRVRDGGREESSRPA